MLDVPGLLFGDPAQTAAKLKGFQEAGTSRLQLVFDFDRTLTVSKSDNIDITTWHILERHLPPAARAICDQQFAYYRPLEISGAMTKQDAETWNANILALFVKQRSNLDEIEQDFLSKATIRPGVKELFDLCAAHGIPTVILSAGIKNIIDIWAKTYAIEPTIVLATTLQTDAHNRVCGWDADTLIHVLNKNEVAHPELTRIREQRSHTILVGDSIHDANMAEGTASVLRVRIHSPRHDEKEAVEAVRSRTFQLFDALIENGRIDPVEKLVGHILQP